MTPSYCEANYHTAHKDYCESVIFWGLNGRALADLEISIFRCRLDGANAHTPPGGPPPRLVSGSGFLCLPAWKKGVSIPDFTQSPKWVQNMLCQRDEIIIPPGLYPLSGSKD